MASLKTGKTHLIILAQLIEKIKRHLCIKNTKVGQILLKLLAIVEFAVQCRAFVGAQDGHKIVDQAKIGHKISF